MIMVTVGQPDFTRPRALWLDEKKGSYLADDGDYYSGFQRHASLPPMRVYRTGSKHDDRVTQKLVKVSQARRSLRVIKSKGIFISIC